MYVRTYHVSFISSTDRKQTHRVQVGQWTGSDRGAMKSILILENVREVISQMTIAQLFSTEISPREVYSLIV